MMNKKISVVIPCYRSEKMLYSVVEEVLKEIEIYPEKEIILVDDGSPDQVWNVIGALSEEHSIVKGIRFSRNFGQHSALLAAYREADGDYIVTMDDDGQSTASGIHGLLEKLEEGWDVVYAKYPHFEKSLFRRFGSFMNRKMGEWLIDKPKTIQGNSFYAMRSFVKEEMIRYDHSYPYIGGLVYRTTQNITEIEIDHRKRMEGSSGYTFAKLVKLWINGFTAFSVKPLRIASFMGFVCSVAGFVMGIVFLVRKLIMPEIPLGYSSLICVVLFVGGMIMMMQGMLGEYVGRLYINSNRSPQYVIKEKTENLIRKSDE